MEQIHFTIDTEALPQPRPRFSKGRAYQPARIVEYKKKIKQAALAAMNGRPPLSTPLKMIMKLGRSTRRRVDVDNLSKAIMDAVNGICYVDDCLVFSLYCTKYFTATPQIEVSIEEIA